MDEGHIVFVFIMAFMLGGITLFWGVIIKYFNSGDIINFFDKKKHDKDKVSKLVGRDMIITGSIIISSAFISIFIPKSYYSTITLLQGAVMIVGVMIAYYHLYKKCKIDVK